MNSVQLAEAWGKRRYEKSFVSKLVDAGGEQLETQHWLESAVGFGYVSREQIMPVLERCSEIGKMLASMIAKASIFCNPAALSLHEQQALYFAPGSED
ncbi:MAG: four helix bundle protein [Anaerolineae bacterium]